MVYSVDGREYRIRGLSPVGLERLRVNLRLTLNGNFHLDTIDLYQARARSLFAQKRGEAVRRERAASERRPVAAD